MESRSRAPSFKLRNSCPTRTMSWMQRDLPTRAGSVPPSIPAAGARSNQRSWLQGAPGPSQEEADELQKLKDLAYDFSKPLSRQLTRGVLQRPGAFNLTAISRTRTHGFGMTQGPEKLSSVQLVQTNVPETKPPECLNFARRPIGFSRHGPASGRRGTRRLRIDTAKSSYEAVSRCLDV